MDVLVYLREKERMCRAYGSRCEGCPAKEIDCTIETTDYKEELVDYVETWAKEHPAYTNAMKMDEVFGTGTTKNIYDWIRNRNPQLGKWFGEEYKEPEE